MIGPGQQTGWGEMYAPMWIDRWNERRCDIGDVDYLLFRLYLFILKYSFNRFENKKERLSLSQYFEQTDFIIQNWTWPWTDQDLHIPFIGKSAIFYFSIL